MAAKLDDYLVYFEPKTPTQKVAVTTFKENDVTFLLGPAGSGKTHLAIALAVMDLKKPSGLLSDGRKRRVDKILVTRPAVEAGEKLGFLPGVVDEKIQPYTLPISDCLNKLVLNSATFMQTYFEQSPLAYMRGRTFENCVAILDEAQNCSRDQLLMFLTRLGVGCKMIITGDIDQSDIGKLSGLRYFVDKLRGLDGIGLIQFCEKDIVRHPLVARMLKRLAGGPAKLNAKRLQGKMS